MSPHEPENSVAHPSEPVMNTTVVAYPTNHSNQRQQIHTGSVYPVTLKVLSVHKLKLLDDTERRDRDGGPRGDAGDAGPLWQRQDHPPHTLLTALGGRLTKNKLSGKVTYNGLPFSSLIKRRTGFVAQDDVLYAHLTVSETLIFTALLRLPRTLSKTEKVQHAQHIMQELGLTQVADSIIGGPYLRGISGGEKKRVSIGQEMLVNPSLLLLDEPTSGGRTVVTTIHQPSSRLYHMFDKVVLLSEGCPIYHGKASDAQGYFESIGFSSPVTVNPADLLLDLANGIAPNSKHAIEDGKGIAEEQKAVREELISAYDKNIATRLKAELCTVSMDPNSNNYNYSRDAARGRREQWNSSWCEQFSVLLRRGMKERRHEAFNKLRIFQVLSVATLGGLLWWHTPSSHLQDRTALLFFFSVFWGFYPLYNAVFTFPQERAMLTKERSSGMYRLSTYFLARTAADLPMELALPTAFVFIIYWMGGLDPHPSTFLLSLLVVLYSVLVAQSLGLAIGAILMDDLKQATTLASVTTLVFLIAGGYYVQQIPPFIVWLKYLSYSFYCYKLLLGVHFHSDDYYECSPGKFCPVIDFPAIKSVGLENLWVDICIMGLMLVGYRLVAYMALHRLQPR
ncbi:uncharacterized protein A4U43_C08F660 [Asparagus officinalis]|nr:uncharacterized protein A4U43_C08F660 [Asparagus officinalis]